MTQITELFISILFKHNSNSIALKISLSVAIRGTAKEYKRHQSVGKEFGVGNNIPKMNGTH